MVCSGHNGFILTIEIEIPDMRTPLVFSSVFVLLKSSFHFVPVLYVEVRHNDLPRLLARGPEAYVQEVGRRIPLRTGHPWSGSLESAVFGDQPGGLRRRAVVVIIRVRDREVVYTGGSKSNGHLPDCAPKLIGQVRKAVETLR